MGVLKDNPFPAPSIREIASAVGVSTTTVIADLKFLEGLGLIERARGARAIRIIEQP